MNVAVLAIVAVLVVVSLIVAFTRRAAAKRRAALEAVAMQMGWSFSADTVAPESLGAGEFPLFTHGRGRKARNVMRVSGSMPPAMLFDYEYTVGSGKHQRTHTQTVVHLGLPGSSIPPFVLGPENVLHKIGGLLGYHDIDFDSSPEFSTKYLLRSKEAESAVRDLFTPAVRDYFEQHAPVTVEGSAGGVLVYRPGDRTRPEDVLAFVEDARAVARQFER